MKKFVFAILFLAGIHLSYGQALTQADCDRLAPYLNKEDWKSAFKESSKLLKANETDSSDFHAMILYINLISAAGMVTETQMSFKELEKMVSKYEGQRIIMMARPVTTRDGVLGKTKFSASETSYEAFTSVTNSKKLNILSFEKFIIKDRININELQDTTVNCGGILEKIETNPSMSINWVLRITVKDAFVRKT